MTSRCSKALLFVSIALNVFLAGFIISHAPGKRMPPYMRLESQLRDLPQPQKAKVDAVLAKYHPDIVTQFNTVRDTREALRAEINAPDYSRAKASKLFDEMQTAYRKMGDASQYMILDVNDQLTPDQRAKFDPLPPPMPGEREKK